MERKAGFFGEAFADTAAAMSIGMHAAAAAMRQTCTASPFSDHTHDADASTLYTNTLKSAPSCNAMHVQAWLCMGGGLTCFAPAVRLAGIQPHAILSAKHVRCWGGG